MRSQLKAHSGMPVSHLRTIEQVVGVMQVWTWLMNRRLTGDVSAAATPQNTVGRPDAAGVASPVLGGAATDSGATAATTQAAARDPTASTAAALPKASSSDPHLQPAASQPQLPAPSDQVRTLPSAETRGAMLLIFALQPCCYSATGGDSLTAFLADLRLLQPCLCTSERFA